MFVPSDSDMDDGDDGDVDDEAGVQLAAVLSSPKAFPHLTSLQLNGHDGSPMWFTSVLDSLPALRKVVLLNLTMDVMELFYVLLHATLSHIHIGGRVVHCRPLSACVCQEGLQLTPHWDTLVLPLEEILQRLHNARPHPAIIPALIEDLTAESLNSNEARIVLRQRPAQPSDEKEELSSGSTCRGLQRLNVFSNGGLSAVHRAAVRSIASLRSLTAVDLPALMDPAALLEFATAASPSTLPHLRVLRCAPVEHSNVPAETANHSSVGGVTAGDDQ